ncbi:MAG TPA: hypothetical protein PKD09_16845 [Aggregatilinea sp.]|uniref:hypothetical protein n=1 Tax=Aggregatilinea sp. TaxID=2806333 RepID=UPI002B616806|nr:hypothetical protein [Aggregatilinea sp.]HML23325.1 hypothetical protein [Aggregatilinea sp.]
MDTGFPDRHLAHLAKILGATPADLMMNRWGRLSATQIHRLQKRVETATRFLIILPFAAVLLVSTLYRASGGNPERDAFNVLITGTWLVAVGHWIRHSHRLKDMAESLPTARVVHAHLNVNRFGQLNDMWTENGITRLEKHTFTFTSPRLHLVLERHRTYLAHYVDFGGSGRDILVGLEPTTEWLDKGKMKRKQKPTVDV